MEHAGNDKLPGDPLFTHCHRELFHAQWKDILDGEFLQVYKHGMVFVCGDNIKRQLFPQIFTYSADYPEKYVYIYLRAYRLKKHGYRVLVANIRNLGGCLCPQCLIPKVKFQGVATEDDMLQRDVLVRHDMVERRKKVLCACKLIYEGHYVVDTPQVEALLKAESLVPTIVHFLRSLESIVLIMIVQNTFAERLGPTGFDFFRMLVVDLLHEFELGVWKSVLVHLLRMLDSLKGAVLAELDHR